MGGYRGTEAMRIAAIDIGSNTVLLLIADVTTDGITPVHHEQRLPRLGRNVDGQGRIHPTAFDQIAWIVNEYKNLARQMRTEKIVAVTTSAVRDADNRNEFLTYIHRTTGIAVEILSGKEEAFLSYIGTLSGFTTLPQETAVLDIGGGSAELTYPIPGHTNGNLDLQHYSFQIGAVRITERFFKDNPPTDAQLESARQNILEELSQVRNPGLYQYTLVGVAGTVTTLACLDQHLPDFDVEKVRGYEMKKERIDYWSTTLSSMKTTDILNLSNVITGREDILTAGVLILREIMSLLGFHEILVSERGLRYGVIIKEWEKHNEG